jgi:hypothetical protein
MGYTISNAQDSLEFCAFLFCGQGRGNFTAPARSYYEDSSDPRLLVGGVGLAISLA